MNQSLISLQLHSIHDIHRFENYEICQQQSQCYLLIPPPRPPIFPKLILTKPTSALTNLHQHTNAFLIIFGLFMTLILTCLLLFFLSIKFQFYHKLQQRYRQRKVPHTTDQPSTISSIISYNSFTTNQSFYPNHAMHIYEESTDYYSQQKHRLTPYYHTYEFSSPSMIVCQNCLFETLHRKQPCLCQNFFIPIK